MLKTVLHNLFHRARTRGIHDLPPIPQTVRGPIGHDATRCTGCGTCAFVCAPKAITVGQAGEAAVAWRFFAGQCSFCGLCEKYCPTKAISNRAIMPTVSGDQSLHHSESIIRMIPCTRCSTMHIPMPDSKLRELLNGELAGTALAEKELCPDCRRKMTGERIRNAFCGSPAAEQGQEGADGHQ